MAGKPIIQCPKCGAKYDASGIPAGAKIKCKKCGTMLALSKGAPEASPKEKGAPKSAPKEAPKAKKAPKRAAAGAPKAKAAPKATSKSKASKDPLIGTDLAYWRVTGKLGEGGMGIVYKGLHKALNREVAIKTLAPELVRNKSYVERFLREARSAASLRHNNVVTVEHVDSGKGVYFMVMEFVEGKTLRDFIIEKHKLPPDEAIDFMIQSARGLAAAEGHGIVHRDIKPDNLMVNTSGVIKIADFGLAKGGSETAQNVTQTGTILGTPNYMSPEQAEGIEVDCRSDLYSLGATFYHALTGLLPFEGDTPIATMIKHQTEKLVAPRERDPEVPQDISDIIEKLMAKKPAERYQSANEVLEDLERLKRGEETAAAKEMGELTFADEEAKEAAPPPEPAAEEGPGLAEEPDARPESGEQFMPFVAPPVPAAEGERSSILPKIITAVVVIGVLGVGGFFGYGKWEEYKAKKAQAEDLKALCEKAGGVLGAAEAYSGSGGQLQAEQDYAESIRLYRVALAALTEAEAKHKDLNAPVPSDLARKLETVNQQLKSLAQEKMVSVARMDYERASGLVGEDQTRHRYVQAIAKWEKFLEKERPAEMTNHAKAEIEKLERLAEEAYTETLKQVEELRGQREFSKAKGLLKQKVLAAYTSKRFAEQSSAARRKLAEIEAAESQAIVSTQFGIIASQVGAAREIQVYRFERAFEKWAQAVQAHKDKDEALKELIERRRDDMGRLQTFFSKLQHAIVEAIKTYGGKDDKKLRFDIKARKGKTSSGAILTKVSTSTVTYKAFGSAEHEQSSSWHDLLPIQVYEFAEQFFPETDPEAQLLAATYCMEFRLMHEAFFLFDRVIRADKSKAALIEDYIRRDPGRQVYINGGRFAVGEDNPEGDTFRSAEVALEGFYIDRYEVTNAEYMRFVLDTKRTRRPTHWTHNGQYEPKEGNFPVTNVTWQDAAEYAKWAGKRLPRELEWEAAARGPEGKAYPWGDQPSSEKANVASRSKEKPIEPVYTRIDGRSPYGCFHMVGNAWEWTVPDDPHAPTTAPDSMGGPDLGMEPGGGGGGGSTLRRGQYIIRGGSCRMTIEQARCSTRRGMKGTVSDEYVGFRCASD